MISRRQALITLSAACAGAASFGTWRFMQSTDEGAIVAVLRKRLGYLQMDEAGLHAYANDMAAARMVSSNKLRFLDAAGALYTYVVPAGMNALTRELHHGEERVVSQYLLSSDFFLKGADVTKTVRYLGYYDPILPGHACRNPFSQPVVLPSAGT